MAKRRNPVAHEAVIAAYFEEGASTRECRRRFKISGARLNGILASAGPRRSRHVRTSTLAITKESLASLYVEGRLTVLECGSHLGVSGVTICRKLKAFGIPIRDPKKASDDDIIRAYVVDGLSLGKVATRLGLSKQAVRSRLVSRDIARREQRTPLTANSVMHSIPIEQRSNQEYHRAYAERVRRTDLKKSLSLRISQLMRRGLATGKAGRIWHEFVPYSVEELRCHLSKSMPAGFSWDDFLTGKLHIDHITPIRVFNFKSPEDYDFGRCWALDNLQLLPEIENKKKGGRISMAFQPTLI